MIFTNFFRFNNCLNLKKRGNPYICAQAIKKELLIAQDDAEAVNAGNPNLKTSSTKPKQRQELLAKKWDLMRRLDNGQIQLLDYMKTIGYKSMSRDQRISSTVFDLTFEKQKDENNVANDSLDQIIEDLPCADFTDSSPIIQKASKGEELRKKRMENVDLTFNIPSATIQFQ